jgi:hypothetical protein
LSKKSIKFELFDLLAVLILAGCIIGFFLFGRIHSIIFFLLIAIGILTLFVLAGRLLAPLYLEGKMKRNLIANGGKLPISIFEKHFKHDSLSEEHLDRLLKRQCIEIVKNTVRLKNGKYKIGLQNRIMMWGTRKTEFRV